MNDDIKNNIAPFAFFGSSRLSAIVLDELKKSGYIPDYIVTTPDKPQGRKLEITPNIVKEWAIKNDVPVLDPIKLDRAFTDELKKASEEKGCQLFVVASYGKIIPQAIIDLPRYGTLNIHPSLLPRYRGPSPLPTAMLEDTKDTGVTIMKLDQEMDHGPIVAQEEIDLSADFPDWPIYEDFEGFMARKGAQLLAKTMPDWISGKIVPIEQDHSKATYTHKIIKEDGLIDISDLTPDTPYERAYGAFRKIQAFHQWPQAYFFIEKKDDKGDGSSSRQMRVKITQASFRNEPAPTMGKLIIEKVIPEGKKEMAYADFARSYLK